MIRKLLFPALAVALLGGCVTSGYQYRSGQGDYYYGQPSTQYRYYGSPYDYYGSPYGYSGYGGYGYYGYSGYGGYAGYPYYYTPPRRHRGDGDGDGRHHGGSGHGDHDHDGHHGGDDPPPPGSDQGARPDQGGITRPRPPWRDAGNGNPRDPNPRDYRRPGASSLPAAPLPSRQGAAPAANSSGPSGGSFRGVVPSGSPQSSSDRDRRRIHRP